MKFYLQSNGRRFIVSGTSAPNACETWLKKEIGDIEGLDELEQGYAIDRGIDRFGHDIVATLHGFSRRHDTFKQRVLVSGLWKRLAEKWKVE